MAFHYYEPEKIVMGKKMKDWLKFAMARALMNAADILENSELPAMKKARYASFDSGIGKDFEDGKLKLEQVYEYGKKVEEPKQTSGKQEKYETIVALYSK